MCKDLGISYLFKDCYIEQHNKANATVGKNPQSLGSTELGRITSASNGLVHGTTLQIPTTGYHTMEESASVEACKIFIELLLGMTKQNQL